MVWFYDPTISNHEINLIFKRHAMPSPLRRPIRSLSEMFWEQMIHQESLYCGRAKKKRETIEIHSYQLFTPADTYFFYIYMHCWAACVIGRLYLFPQTTPIDCYAMMRFMINRQGYQSFRTKETWSITTWISFIYVFLYLDNIVIGLSYA